MTLREEKNISVSHMANAILILRKELSQREDIFEFAKYINKKALFKRWSLKMIFKSQE